MNGRILDLKRTIRERGRIRIGITTVKRGKRAPAKLDRFRFTAPDERTIREVASLYGGEPEQWPDGGPDQWQVITDARSLPVIIVTAMGLSQAYEQWRNGFCVRRCDGVRSFVPAGKRMREEPCVCDPEARECQLTTNLSVILPDIRGLGVWRLVSHGWYAATELAGAVELIEAATAAGIRVPARLGLEQRERRRIIDGKPQVWHFAVPTLDLDMTVAELDAGLQGSIARHPAASIPEPRLEAVSEAPSGRSWQPVDQDALPPAPLVSVADQLADNDRPVKRRANAAPAIAATGRRPRPAADVPTDLCAICGQPYGTEPLQRNPEPAGSRYVHRTCLEPDASQGRDDAPDGEGTTSDSQPAAAGPVPIGSRLPMTHGQHGMLFALSGEVWGHLEPNEQRSMMLGLAGALGYPGLTSRTEIKGVLAAKLIDALQNIRDGRAHYDGSHYVVADLEEPPL